MGGNLNTNSIKMTPKPSTACNEQNVHLCQTKKFVRVCNVDTVHDADASEGSCRKIDNTLANLQKVRPCKIAKFSVKTGDEYDCSVRNMDVDTSYALTMGEQSYWRYGSADSTPTGYIPRTDKTSWAYNFGVSVTDPMHATDDVQYYSDEALTAWYKVNGGDWYKTDNAKPDKINTLRTGYQTIDYYVEDGAGSYGFGQTNNINFHRVELEFYDHIKPKIYLGCYKNDNRPAWPTHNARQYRASGDAADPTPFAGHCVTTVGSQDLCGSGQCSFTPENQQDVTLECVGTHDSAGTELDSYVEPGMTILDNVDSWEGENIDPIRYSSLAAVAATAMYSITPSSPVATFSQTVTEPSGANTVVYKARDAHENDAAPLTRAVTTVDRYAPILTLVGDQKVQNSAGAAKNHEQDGQENAATTWENSADGLFNHNEFGINAGTSGSATSKGYTCTDQCNKESDLTISIRLFQDSSCNTDRNGVTSTDKEIKGDNDSNDWEFPEYVTGSYAILYKCMDKAGNYALECRDVENVDHTRPIIQILGSNDMTLEATHQGNYIDDGATCSDQAYGVISQNVEVSGDVVNLSKVGLYKIQYNCKDNADRAATMAERKVRVEQTSCPTCKVEGCDEATGCSMYHEASFAYTDSGAKCSDVIDGDITAECVTCNDEATNCDMKAETNDAVKRESCNVPTLISSDKIGTYYITYVAQNTVNKWNYDDDCRGKPTKYVRTVIVQDTLKPVITLKYGKDENGKDKVVAQGQVSTKSLAKYDATHPNEQDQSSRTTVARNAAEAE